MTPIRSVPLQRIAVLPRGVAEIARGQQHRAARGRSRRRPRAVTRTPRAPRSKICTPSACSTCAICALIDGCATPHASAALRNPPRSATATRYCSCRSEYGTVSQRAIAQDYHFETDDILDALGGRFLYCGFRRHPHVYRSKVPFQSRRRRRPLQPRLVAEPAAHRPAPSTFREVRSDGSGLQLRQRVQQPRPEGA